MLVDNNTKKEVQVRSSILKYISKKGLFDMRYQIGTNDIKF